MSGRTRRSRRIFQNDPGWPESREKIFQRFYNLEDRNRGLIKLWCTCRLVCRDWKHIIENPTTEALKRATFKSKEMATTDSTLIVCILATKWIQKQIDQEIRTPRASPQLSNRQFGLRCYNDFKLLWSNSTVLAMYATQPVVKDVRIRIFMQQYEVNQRNLMLRSRGFNIDGAAIFKAWDGWHMTAPGGIKVEMLVGFVALAFEIDVLMEYPSTAESHGSLRPQYLDLEFLYIDGRNAAILTTVRFHIPSRPGGGTGGLASGAGSGQSPLTNLWQNLMNAVNRPDSGNQDYLNAQGFGRG